MCLPTADFETGEPPVEAVSRKPLKQILDPLLLDGHPVEVCRHL